MQLFCPACQAAFSGVSRCPRCSTLLLMPQELVADAAAARPDDPDAPVRPTPLGRVGVGTVVALGLYLGFRRLASAWALATASDADGWWLTAEGLTAVFACQGLAALFGAALAGAGRPRGFVLGLVVGGVCGALFLAAELLAGTPPGQLVLILQPAILAAGGGLAGAAGARIWPPVPQVDMPIPAGSSQLSSLALAMEKVEETPRPTLWLRVIVGATIMVAGIGVAEQARKGAQKYSGGLLKVETMGQARFLSWQIAALAVLGGGVVAGAATGAGFRHGALAGVLGGMATAGMVSQGEPTQPVAFWLDRLQLAATTPLEPAALVGVAFGVFVGGVLGGWLGGQLWLPLAPEHMRGRRLHAAD